MAEFKDVLIKWKRMCESMPEIGDDRYKCENCPIYGNGWCEWEISQLDPDEIEDIETGIMKWAEEHPMQLYPTWIEWFESLGMKNINADEEIPAEIAEKLGIKPKEK